MKNLFIFILSILIFATLFSFDIQIKESKYYPQKLEKEYNLMILENKIENVKVFLMNNALREEINIEENLNNSLNYNYEYIPVKDNSNKFLGLITKNDLLKIHFNSKKNTITDISKYIINENAKVEQNQKIKSLMKKFPLKHLSV